MPGPRRRARRERPDAPGYVTELDATSALLAATAAGVRGEEFRGLGFLPPWPRVARIANLPPRWAVERIYRLGGRMDALDPERLDEVDAEELRRWAAGQYEPRRYPAVAIGSANGAATHLWTALGVPWLPQTFLVPVRHDGDPDDPQAALEWGARVAPRLLRANPDLEVRHAHDPTNDRLMLPVMAYFRLKALRLGPAYERFLLEALEPGGTIVLLDCRAPWPTTRVAERHVFQFGGYDGCSVDEYFGGGPRVEAFLERERSRARRWDPPEPDGERPETEWGLQPGLGTDVERFAGEHGLRVRRVAFDHPEEPSAPVADLHRWWYERRGLPVRRLLAETYLLLEPALAVETGSVPLWLIFNGLPSAEALEGYLERAAPFEEVALTLVSNGVRGVGLASEERWRTAARGGRLLGSQPGRYPYDFAAWVRYQRAIATLPRAGPRPSPLTLDELDAFLAEGRGGDGVDWGR